MKAMKRIIPALACSAMIFAANAMENNLLKNSDFSAPLVTWKQPDTGWYSTIWIAGQGNMAKYLKATKDVASGRIVETDRGKALELLRPPELEKIMGNDVTLFTISFSQTVKLPDENSGLYRVTFDCRNEILGQKRFAQMLLFSCLDSSGKLIKGYNRKIQSESRWSSYSGDFEVPQKTVSIRITIRVDGCGLFQFNNPKFVKLNP